MTSLKPKITTRKNPGGSVSFCVDAGIIDDKRHRKFFSNKREARAYARKMQAARKKQGALAFALTPRQQIDAGRAFERLEQYGGVTLLDAVSYYVKHAQPRGGKKPVSAAVAEFLEIKKKAGNKPRYIKELTCKFGNFKNQFADRMLNEITPLEIEDWLSKQNFSPVTQQNYLRDLGILFRWAMESRNYCAENVIDRIQKPKATASETEIFDVRESLSLLFAAQLRSDLELVPYLAIGFFAGLRASELAKLDWKNIELRQATLKVTAASAKTSQHRLVKISENLAAWLKPHEKMEGPIVPRNLYRRLDELRAMAEIEKWPQNGLRHSYGSYHFAYHQNANLTASEMGHETTKMLFRHYRKMISPEDAREYWHIYPANGWAMLPPSEHLERLAPRDQVKNQQKKELLLEMLAACDKSPGTANESQSAVA